ncbi:MAG TPA: hypothetical protein PKM43_24010, partial [Verrucomicrobiota bacterium]|nr:hypothetical protein [Verrucomicrobiota bacterium]
MAKDYSSLWAARGHNQRHGIDILFGLPAHDQRRVRCAARQAVGLYGVGVARLHIMRLDEASPFHASRPTGTAPHAGVPGEL